ncbi:hypothetical protein [Pseudomonas sp. ICMP 8385]|uniref:hypothetical protein n=1 Tax=Pseudomonas sp. ICMP 8385 TaxID=1718920 RepID=UPI00159BAC52|nr:hypothetical protein [Pseudomonas sp. ICMP 8385]
MISWVGIDISKSNLVVWVQPQGEGFEVSNLSEGFAELIKRLNIQIKSCCLGSTSGRRI